jgi:hypothetical protein
MSTSRKRAQQVNPSRASSVFDMVRRFHFQFTLASRIRIASMYATLLKLLCFAVLTAPCATSAGGRFILKLKGIVVYKFLKLAAILAIAISLTTGCANRATGSVNPSTDLSALKTMYVRHYPSDNSGVNLEIADKLRSKGVTVTTGPAAPSNNFDAIVTYVDKWRWDITMYLLELTITIRDPKTESPMATGNSFHTSLTRKSQTEMVDEVVNNIYNSSNSAGAQPTSKTPTQQPGQSNTTTQNVLSPAPSITVSETPRAKDLSQKLQELENLRKKGIITEDEYISKRKQTIEKF